MNLASLRSEFPVLERVAYLNTGTAGPIPRRAVAAARAELDRLAAEGRGDHAAFDRLVELREELRGRVARLLGCDDDELALTASTTDGVNVVISGLRLGPGDEVITSEGEHPGIAAPLAAARDRLGFELRVAPLAELPGAVGPRTRLVACQHVSWVTGEVVDAAAISASGVPLLLDGAQGLGAVTLDVRALGCDWYAASGQKWLCGPMGTGYLYVRRERIPDTPLTRPAYGSLEDPAKPLESALRPEAARFDTVLHPPDVTAWALAALELFDEHGLDALQGRAHEGAAWLAGRLGELGLDVAPRGDSTLVSWAADDPEAESKRLREEGFVVRFLPGTRWVRASVGGWNDQEELEGLATASAD